MNAIARKTSFRPRWWVLMVMICASCHAAPPPPPPEAPPPPPPPPAVVEVPPPPKCEKVEEGCVAASETRARIGQAGWQFAPPPSWTYAQGEEFTIASSKHAIMAVTARPSVDAKKERAEREVALKGVAGKLGLTLPKKKTFLGKKPDHKQKVGDVDVEFYQLDGAKLDGRPGPLLFFVAKASKDRTLVGAGFVSEDDGDNADQAIMTAIESLGPAAASEAAVEAAKTP